MLISRLLSNSIDVAGEKIESNKPFVAASNEQTPSKRQFYSPSASRLSFLNLQIKTSEKLAKISSIWLMAHIHFVQEH
jgi:hypothetical protein